MTARAIPYQEIAFRPGERWSYSNPAFIYLARIIEAVTGDPYQSYIQKNIWTPLGMTRGQLMLKRYACRPISRISFTSSRHKL